MRLWTLHPRYLDARGLVALWREGLLAQKVLAGNTRGYTRHPQLERFRAQADPAAMIGAYLRAVLDEATVRGYAFDGARIAPCADCRTVEESEGQLLFEWAHLLAKLARRDPARHLRWKDVGRPDAHPLFAIVPGPRCDWERGNHGITGL